MKIPEQILDQIFESKLSQSRSRRDGEYNLKKIEEQLP